MVVLLSVGEAMLDQSRDVSLVGGGEVTVLPQGIDVEAMRTGGLSGMFFTIERARFLTRQILGGPRHAALIAGRGTFDRGEAALPLPGTRPLRADRRCAPAARSRVAPPPSAPVSTCATGRWSDTRADSAYVLPTRQQLYDELDRFHVPRRADSTWGEWHYFNFVTGPDEWWYVTYLRRWRAAARQVGRTNAGHPPAARWEVRPVHGGRSSGRVTFDTTRADLIDR